MHHIMEADTIRPGCGMARSVAESNKVDSSLSFQSVRCDQV